ncbi:MAG: hypothetical protein ACUVXJ_13385, partial [Phycisphaerae bacterium]
PLVPDSHPLVPDSHPGPPQRRFLSSFSLTKTPSAQQPKARQHRRRLRAPTRLLPPFFIIGHVSGW